MRRGLAITLGFILLGMIAIAASGITTSTQNTGNQAAASPPVRCPAGDVGPPVSAPEKFTAKFITTAQGDLQKPVVVGRTNLPVGTELLISLERAASAYDAQSNTVVKSDGCFVSEQFTQGGEPINPGDYVIDVLMPVTTMQPQSVRSIVGELGQNIVGPLAKRFHHLGKIAEYKVRFTVGIADAKKDADARQVAANDEDKRLSDLRSEASLLAAKTLKANLRNPESADWMSIYTNKNGSNVCIVVRAQNGFGGMNVERYAVVDQRFSAEISVWNRICAGNGFYDYTNTVKLVE